MYPSAKRALDDTNMQIFIVLTNEPPRGKTNNVVSEQV